MGRLDQGYVYAVIAVIFWATVASAFKISLRYFDFLQLLFFASIVSITFFFVALLVQNKLALLKTYSRKDYLHSALFGFLNPFLYYVVLFKDLLVTSCSRSPDAKLHLAHNDCFTINSYT